MGPPSAANPRVQGPYLRPRGYFTADPDKSAFPLESVLGFERRALRDGV